MARIDDLLEEIPDTALRAHLEREVTRLRKATRFGLMFERHWPETAILLAGRFGEPIWHTTMRQLLTGWLDVSERDELVRRLAAGGQADGRRHEHIDRLDEQVAELRQSRDGALAAFAQHASDRH